jgi:hypothetical protein
MGKHVRILLDQVSMCANGRVMCLAMMLGRQRFPRGQ